ncbi:hypothetical protein OA328_02075 [Paracoccaceae bacterium]|nr:hypothetical protein [Paracoccaceae bacterium]
MDLKKTTKLPTSVEINLQPRSERNDANNHRVYNVLFPEIEDATDPISDKDGSQKFHEKHLFVSVSTLDWLTTWRPLETS